MKNQIWVFITILFLSCTQEVTDQQKFLSHLKEFCGYAYPGKTTLANISSGHLFEDAELTIHLRHCEKGKIRIPVHVGDDQSRTWILKYNKGDLHLSHDHRNPDGSRQEDNFYGGYANPEGKETIQYFPADEQTIANRPGRSINTWAIEVDPVGKNFFYRLYLSDALRLEMMFDLSSHMPLE